MIPAQFDYARPANLEDALRILKDREGEAKLLSGGYSLIPLLKLRLAQPALLVDLRDVTGLDSIVETDDYLRIGATATHRQIHENPIVRRPLPAARTTWRAGSATRRSATGARSAARSPTPIRHRTGRRLSSPRNAIVVCRGQGGERKFAARDFFLDTFTDRHRADRGPDRDPLRAPSPRPGRRVREARAQGR